MRVAIVNDMTLAVEALRRVVASMPGYELAWVARNGIEAVERCALDTPELILMDLVMPVMDGVEATCRIMARSPCAILVVAAAVDRDSKQVFAALSAGALDAVQTPAVNAGTNRPGGAEKLKLKIETIRHLITDGYGRNHSGRVHESGQSKTDSQVPLVAIGASAGGPGALATIFRQLPRDFPAAIVIVQHIDVQFAPVMANWLNKQSVLPVRTAREKEPPQAGVAFLASTKDHLVLLDSHTLGYIAEPRSCHYRPSVDVFFESVALHWKGDVVAALLTGMGRDGAKGLKALRDAGAVTIAQDAQSCVVYGMPKAAAELNAAAEILSLDNIAPALTNVVKSKKQGKWQ